MSTAAVTRPSFQVSVAPKKKSVPKTPEMIHFLKNYTYSASSINMYLRNPMEFMGEKGKYILQHPQKIASRTRAYAKYDFVQVFNELMDAFHISQSVLEKILAKFMALPAERFLQVKRQVSC